MVHTCVEEIHKCPITQCASQPLFALSSGGRPMEHVSHYYWTQLSHESDNQRCLCMLKGIADALMESQLQTTSTDQ
ncbi:hypothetical protein H5410_005394, partial [Solanum commersonii]